MRTSRRRKCEKCGYWHRYKNVYCIICHENISDHEGIKIIEQSPGITRYICDNCYYSTPHEKCRDKKSVRSVESAFRVLRKLIGFNKHTPIPEDFPNEMP